MWSKLSPEQRDHLRSLLDSQGWRAFRSCLDDQARIDMDSLKKLKTDPEKMRYLQGRLSVLDDIQGITPENLRGEGE